MSATLAYSLINREDALRIAGLCNVKHGTRSQH